MSGSPVLEATLAQYGELARRLDEKFLEIQARHRDQFACRQGCHSCCKPGLTVNALEAENLRRHLAERPELASRLRALAAGNPHRGKRCAFLSAEGACEVYEARPFVCRSHGAPLQMKPEEVSGATPTRADENVRVRDVCPLNFPGQSLAQLPPESVLNLDTLNTLLALLSSRAFPKDERRVPLRLDDLLASR